MRISVVICTRNRKNDLRITLDGFYNQDYEDFEVIVIDNASNDGTDEMIKNEYSNVLYTYLPINIDILAQNIGINQATGDVIWRTDSDSHPESKDTFTRVVELFKSQPNLDIISTTETLVKKDFLEVKLSTFDINNGNIIDGYYVKSFSGPGSAIRKNVFKAIGYFWEFGMEELDFSIRALNGNFTIKHFPTIRTLHYSSENDRNRGERWLNISNQNLRIIVKYYPVSKLYNLILCILGQLFVGVGQKVKFSFFFEYLFQSAVTILKTWRVERVPIKNTDFERIIGKNEYIKGFYSYFKNLLK